MSVSLDSTTVELAEALNTLIFDINSFWLIFSSSIVFFMQTGFALLEAGGVRSKNVRNILTKNILDACIGTAMWYFVGYGYTGILKEYLQTRL